MKERTDGWIKIISSILIFDIPIFIALLIFSLVSWYSLVIKVIIDAIIIFGVDKSIEKVNCSLSFKDGGKFSIKRK